jgi:hypothetical protein
LSHDKEVIPGNRSAKRSELGDRDEDDLEIHDVLSILFVIVSVNIEIREGDRYRRCRFWTSQGDIR